MQVTYHCLGCGKQESVKVDLITAIQQRKNDYTLLDVIAQHIRQTIHTTCPKAAMGVKSCPVSEEKTNE